MKKKSNACLFLLFAILFFSSNGNLIAQDASPILGRWDITVHMAGKEFPSWLEVDHSGFHALVGSFVSIVGSARPISQINFADNKMSFTIPPQREGGNGDVHLEASFQGDSLSGTGNYSDGKTFTWTAHRAPSLKRSGKPVWGTAIRLFNGKDLTGWHAMGENQWKVENGILRSPHSGANLITDKTFTDFKLHIEFRFPKGSNSGIYLRGRYETQIEDDHDNEPALGLIGAIYGFVAPSEIAAKGPGEWQTYDITLVGRMVTVVLNGVTVICNREIPGITGGAINSREEEPGPLLIQGDHGPIDYRNIVLTPAK